MKRIWFVSHYSMPPEYEMRIKTQMFSHYLNEMGYETEIFSASTIHNTNINLINDNSKYISRTYDDLNFVHVNCHNYSGNGFRRIRNMLEFSNKFKKIAKFFKLPDIVIADVNCVNYSSIYKFCKMHNIKFYIDIRDLWPMSIIEYLGYSKNNPIIKYLYYREKIMYKRANGIIFSMEGGKDYIQDKGWDNIISLKKVYNINNGINLEIFNKNRELYKFNDTDLDNNNVFKVIYVGSIRKANNLKDLIDCAFLLKKENISFILYGDGEDKDDLENYSKKNNINVVFKGHVEKKYIPYVLSKSDLNILNYKQGNAWKYGGSQNKLFEYFASGKPVLANIEMGCCLIKRYNCGISGNINSPKDYAQAILKIKSLSLKDYQEYCNNAIKAANDFDYKALTDKLIEIID